MFSYCKKLVSSIIRDSISDQSRSMGSMGSIGSIGIVKLLESPLSEVKVNDMSSVDSNTIVKISSLYTMEEELIIYPDVIVHKSKVCPYIVIDIE